MKNIPELLAPVGGFEQLMAAVENGADAVYLGGEFFNARIKAENFDLENMGKAIAYAHIRNVKVFVAMNTLLYDDELSLGLEYARQMNTLGVDAVILQDVGLARLVRRHLPEMKMHLSTQGSVYNLSGVKMAATMGFERVVLARETSLEEIRTICRENVAEIEVFVHGALCMCYSGQCQLSRSIGGRSGNRGLCAQPCRLGFETTEGMEYPLSTKDLCTIDHLGELAEAGVGSLKIEGRMKSPEYVAIVTGIYRKYLDLYAKEGAYTVSKEDREELTQIFSRGEFTEGYLFGNPKEHLQSGILPKHQGVLIGHVTRGNAGQGLMEIRLAPGKTLNLGDGIEIHNEELTGNVITYLKQEKNGNLQIGDLKGKSKPGDPVFKITDKALMLKARNTFKENSWEACKSLKKIDIEMKFTCEPGSLPLLEIIEKNSTGETIYKIVVQGEQMGQKAINRPLTEEKIKSQLEKLGDTPFRAKNMTVMIGADLSLPVSSLNELRRNGISKLAEEKSKGRELVKFLEPDKIPRSGPGNKKKEILLELYYFTVTDLKKEELMKVLARIKDQGLDFQRIRIVLPVDELLQAKKRLEMELKGFELIPYIPSISKGKLDDFLSEHFDEIVYTFRDQGIYIGNLGWIEALQNEGVKLFGDFGLNINNVEAENWLKEIGIQEFLPSLESFKGTRETDWHFEGSVPLMITEHPMDRVFREPKRENVFKAIYLKKQEKSILFKVEEETGLIGRIEDVDWETTNLRIFMA